MASSVAFLVLVVIAAQQVTARQQFLRSHAGMGSGFGSSCFPMDGCELAKGKTQEEMLSVNGDCSNCIRELGRFLPDTCFTEETLNVEACKQETHNFQDLPRDVKVVCHVNALRTALELYG